MLQENVLSSGSDFTEKRNLYFPKYVLCTRMERLSFSKAVQQQQY